MIVSIDAEKGFDTHPFMIKMLSEVGEGTNFNMTNPQPSNPQVEIFSRSGTRQGHQLSPLLVNILAVLARAIGQDNTFGGGGWGNGYVGHPRFPNPTQRSTIRQLSTNKNYSRRSLKILTTPWNKNKMKRLNNN